MNNHKMAEAIMTIRYDNTHKNMRYHQQYNKKLRYH